jgi:hypothetical protein
MWQWQRQGWQVYRCIAVKDKLTFARHRVESSKLRWHCMAEVEYQASLLSCQTSLDKARHIDIGVAEALSALVNVCVM